MTQAQLHLHNLQIQLDQTHYHLTTQPPFKDSPVLFLEPFDTVLAHASEQTEQTEQNTSSLQKFTLLLITYMKHHLHRKNETKS